MTPTRASHQSGYSLVEVMVVLAVVALLAGAAALMLPSGTPEAQRAADRLALDLMRAERAAITSGDFFGLTVTGEGYAFSRFDGEAWQSGEPGGLRAVRLGDEVRLLTDAEGAPAYWFDPTGVNGEVRFVLDDGEHRVAVAFANGAVRIEGEGA